MVCKKSEYRKQFRKPSWGSHINHYNEKVDYCKHRRYLEHRHTFVPWDWDSSSNGSTGSSDDRPQTAPNRNNNGGGVSKGRKDIQQHPPPEGRDEDRRREAQQRLAPPEPGNRVEQDRGRRALRESNNLQQPPRSQSKPQPVVSVRPKPSTSPPKTRKVPPGKGKLADQPPWKPPIAAYGWADSSRDVASKLTYNVKSSAHPAYVHPSAIRAMKHKEMLAAERQKEEDRLARYGKPTARAVFTVIPPRENVWLTTYQSSYCSPEKPS
ncbi:centriole, cilia and spindle-associated protein-like [Amphiura filiformis]|uniref:centriole, cilia and spindle-associated protein-like n=1 Tax=Amphiura filiformis TaxID=82378 RepID=UPI003B211BD3